MQPVNLFVLSEMCDNELFSEYETIYSRREKNETSLHEQKTLSSFVEYLLRCCSFQCNDMDNFYFSYHIPQISKEFDLLRISQHSILNVELKKADAKLEKVQQQLVRNRYYLKHLGKSIYLFTYIDDGRLYTINEKDELYLVQAQDLISSFEATKEPMTVDIDSLFCPSAFLVSPLNTPQPFLNGEYFLTSQQEEIEEKIITAINNNESQFYGITGKPGTGKTLVLYDLAKKLSAKKQCCIVHCAPLSEGHDYLKKNMRNCTIITPKEFTSPSFDSSPYDYLLFDEFHRAYDNVFEKAKAWGQNPANHIIFSYDFGQMVSRSEMGREIEKKIADLIAIKTFTLSAKIRTNKEMASFIQRLLSPKQYKNDNHYTYSNVSVIYSKDRAKTIDIIGLYNDLGYTHINHSVSLYKEDPFDSLNQTPFNAHKVFGQEFDKVIVVLDKNFFYRNDILESCEHANPDYLYIPMLYEEVTRVREKLCIVVEDNLPLLKRILALFDSK